MEEENMLQDKDHLPELIVFAGPNGSGKSTITKYAKVLPPYINADDIKLSTNCSDLEAALEAETMREAALKNRWDFTFETVLSTDRNLDLMRRAKQNGYFIRCIYVLTADPAINVFRVQSRKSSGGHGVPEDKIRSRYEKALKLLPELIDVCDILHIYDNTIAPFRIFKKRKTEYFAWENEFWPRESTAALTGVSDFSN